MKRKWIGGIVLIGALAVPAGSWAHKGHTHKVMGIVTSIDGTSLQLGTPAAATPTKK